MLAATQTTLNVTLTPWFWVPEISVADRELNLSQLPYGTESDPSVSVSYPESAYRWLAGILERFIEVVHRHEKSGINALTEEDYEFLDEVLGELIYSIGEGKNPPLAALMESIVWLIDTYEAEYVPEPTTSFPDAVCRKPNLAAVYVNLGAVKVKLHRIDEAKSNFQTALELAAQQGQAELKAAIDKQLLQLNHSAPQGDDN